MWSRVTELCSWRIWRRGTRISTAAVQGTSTGPSTRAPLSTWPPAPALALRWSPLTRPRPRVVTSSIPTGPGAWLPLRFTATWLAREGWGWPSSVMTLSPGRMPVPAFPGAVVEAATAKTCTTQAPAPRSWPNWLQSRPTVSSSSSLSVIVT